MKLKQDKHPQSYEKTPWSLKISRFITGDSAKKSTSKVKASLIAIIIGLLLGIIPIVIAGGKPFSGYWLMISGPLSPTALRRTITIISVFIILGAGIGVSFRTGLFNIGATGQFLMAGTICVIIGINGIDENGAIVGGFNKIFSKPLALMILFLVALLVGALMASIPGILKAFFNVHEVVTTILLNWVVLYFVRWLVSLNGIRSGDGTSTLTVASNSSFSLSTSSFDFIYILMIALIMVLFLFVLFKFTNFGYRLKLNGVSESVAKYSGINTKINTIYSMMISGAFAGVAGFIFYTSVERVVPRLDTLPTIGFEAITVTLLAFSSPLGAVLSGFFYGLLYQGQNFMQVGAGGSVVRETATLTLGIIIFMAALASTFVDLHLWKWAVNKYRWLRSHKIKKLKHKWKNEKIKTINLYNRLIDEAKVHHQARLLKLQKVKYKWVEAVNAIGHQYQIKKINILEKDEQIVMINHRYLNIIEDQKLNELPDMIKNKKLALKEIDKKYRFLIDKELVDFENQLKIFKKEKHQEINVIVMKKLDKSQKKQAIAHVVNHYHNQKNKLFMWWKGGK